MNFCSHCAAPVTWKIPPGDDHPRHVCDACGTIHYQNPKIVAACIPEWEDKILLCKRAIEPKLGWWTLPGGFMENQETTAEAALRETWEEAQAKVVEPQLYMMVSIPHISQVYLVFRGALREPVHAPGVESLETALFGADEIPWAELAFPVIRQTLTRYYEDQPKHHFPVHVENLIRD